MPFVTIVRKPDVQVGTNQKSMWNIPGHHVYSYYKVPTWNGGRAGVDVYKVPQPTSVDMTYEVRLFCLRMRELNKFNLKIQKTFQSRQFYISPNGHPMPVHLENVGDESPIDDFENRRFYVQMFEMKLLGHILDEEDFKVIPSINRNLIMVEVDEVDRIPIIKIQTCDNKSTININVVSKPMSKTEFNFISQYDAYFTDITALSNVSNIICKVDGVVQAIPFRIRNGQEMTVSFTKNISSLGKFTIKGNLG